MYKQLCQQLLNSRYTATAMHEPQPCRAHQLLTVLSCCTCNLIPNYTWKLKLHHCNNRLFKPACCKVTCIACMPLVSPSTHQCRPPQQSHSQLQAIHRVKLLHPIFYRPVISNARVQHIRTAVCHAAKPGQQHAVPSAVSKDHSQHSSALQQQQAPSLLCVVARGLQVLKALLKLWSLQHSNSTSSPPPSTSPINAPTSSRSSQQQSYAAQVQQTVSDLGPLWVKLGQTLAVRPDVIGSRLSAALSGLQESAPPYATATAAAILHQELGADPSELFAWWSQAPVASASLGQVYQAAVKSSGLLVAVKVQRPNVADQISLDLAILTQLLRLLRWAARVKQDITAWATTLGQGLAQELDYVQEGRNLEEFAAAHSYLAFVDTPTVIWELTTQRVLTTTWVEGQTPGQILRSLRDTQIHVCASKRTHADSHSHQQQHLITGDPHEQQQQQQQQLLQLVDLGIQASLYQLVVTGVLHADPHPGNLLLSEGKLVYLDFGLLVKVPQQASLAMMAALLHWSQGNWLALAGDMRLMGLLKPTTDLQELAHDLQERFTSLYAASTQQQQEQQQEQQQQQQSNLLVDSILEPQLSSSSNSACNDSSTTGTTTRAAAAAAAVAAAATSLSGQPSMLLQRAGAIGFAEFAGVIAALAIKYRFELPPYYTLVIRSLTTLEGFALLVEPSARQNIAQTAVKVIARQLLVDSRPAARQLLHELLVLQIAPGQPGRLNLQLLQDLLLLTHAATAQQQELCAAPQAAIDSTVSSPGSRPAGKPEVTQGIPGLDAVDAKHQWPIGSFRRSGGSAEALQSLDPVHFVQQQLGLPAAVVAAQLSSPEAGRVRQLLAHQLLRHWQGRPGVQQHQQQQQQQDANTLLLHQARVDGGQAQPTKTAAAVAAGAHHSHKVFTSRPRIKAVSAGTDRVGRSGPSFKLLGWLVQAGFSGFKLACQLLWLAVALTISRVVARCRMAAQALWSTFA